MDEFFEEEPLITSDTDDQLSEDEREFIYFKRRREKEGDYDPYQNIKTEEPELEEKEQRRSAIKVEPKEEGEDDDDEENVAKVDPTVAEAFRRFIKKQMDEGTDKKVDYTEMLRNILEKQMLEDTKPKYKRQSVPTTYKGKRPRDIDIRNVTRYPDDKGVYAPKSRDVRIIVRDGLATTMVDDYGRIYGKMKKSKLSETLIERGYIKDGDFFAWVNIADKKYMEKGPRGMRRYREPRYRDTHNQLPRVGETVNLYIQGRERRSVPDAIVKIVRYTEDVKSRAKSASVVLKQVFEEN